ncbi:MAG: hypothetical protein KGN77_06690 [Xanthomonadaceae bacterium]|nr:hypothetical protein [Xanthomonadaceae bacterium]MDE1962553.1 hypothetical protein [Xanthomonadaceae bacterium]
MHGTLPTLLATALAPGFDRVRIEPVSLPRRQRGSESGAIFTPFPQQRVLTAAGYSPATPKGGHTAQVVALPTLDALKAADSATIKGRIVCVGARMTRQEDGQYDAIGSSVRMGGPVIAQAEGAADRCGLRPGKPGGGGADLPKMHARGRAALSLTRNGTGYFDWRHTSEDTLDAIDPQDPAQNAAVCMASRARGDVESAPGAFSNDGAAD